MTTLYKSVLIESAEQAEALPIGTVATDLGSSTISAAVRTDVGLGWFVSGDEMTDMHEHMVGWTALVPIEAEEETGNASPPSELEPTHFLLGEPGGLRYIRDGEDITDEVAAWEATRKTRRRYVTAWEPA